MYETPLSYHWSDPPDDGGGYTELMQFRLIYEGSLKTASKRDTRVREKHEIRRQLHWQLVELWRRHPGLAAFRKRLVRSPILEGLRMEPAGDDEPEDVKKIVENQDKALVGLDHLLRMVSLADYDESYIEKLAKRFVRSNGFSFVPLVSKELELVCGLDILFLRRSDPGSIVGHGGDVDNRIKTLMDALRIPSDGGELGSAVPAEGEDPLFVLLEDDALISELNIKTDRLLTKPQENGSPNDVMLIINVTVRVSSYNRYNARLIL
ncbi:MAG: hypothetical protein ABI857_13530 [Acidobacteriota bacterium]